MPSVGGWLVAESAKQHTLAGQHIENKRGSMAAAVEANIQNHAEERDRKLFLAAGAAGHAAIYTEHLEAVHILRKVILRVGAYLNYLILKLH